MKCSGFLLLLAGTVSLSAELTVDVIGVPGAGFTQWTFSGDSMTWTQGEAEADSVFRSSGRPSYKLADSFQVTEPAPSNGSGPAIGINIFKDNSGVEGAFPDDELFDLIDSDAEVFLGTSGWVPLTQIFLDNDRQPNSSNGDDVGFRTEVDTPYQGNTAFFWRGSGFVLLDITEFQSGVIGDGFHSKFGQRGDFRISFSQVSEWPENGAGQTLSLVFEGTSGFPDVTLSLEGTGEFVSPTKTIPAFAYGDPNVANSLDESLGGEQREMISSLNIQGNPLNRAASVGASSQVVYSGGQYVPLKTPITCAASAGPSPFKIVGLWLRDQGDQLPFADDIGLVTDQPGSAYWPAGTTFYHPVGGEEAQSWFELDEEIGSVFDEAFNVAEMSLSGNLDEAHLAICLGPDLLVTDREHGAVLRFDGETGGFRGVFGDETLVSRPRDIAIGPDGGVYVVDSSLRRVVRYESDGSGGSVFGDADTEVTIENNVLEPFYPWSLAWDSEGKLFVSQRDPDPTDNQPHGRIFCFDATGAFLYSFDSGVSDAQGGQALAIDPADRIFVTVGSETGGQSILHFDNQGNPLGTGGVFGDASDSIIGLRAIQGDIAFDAQGYLYVKGIVDWVSLLGQIYRFDPDGHFLGRLEGAHDQALVDNLYEDLGLVVDVNRRVFASVSSADAIRFFDSAGKLETDGTGAPGNFIDLDSLQEWSGYLGGFRPNGISFTPVGE